MRARANALHGILAKMIRPCVSAACIRRIRMPEKPRDAEEAIHGLGGLHGTWPAPFTTAP
jgi:hypothetical protein